MKQFYFVFGGGDLSRPRLRIKIGKDYYFVFGGGDLSRPRLRLKLVKDYKNKRK